jgi:TRAP-type mannitol/chloroaromatic compound transport system permease large subunit
MTKSTNIRKATAPMTAPAITPPSVELELEEDCDDDCVVVADTPTRVGEMYVATLTPVNMLVSIWEPVLLILLSKVALLSRDAARAAESETSEAATSTRYTTSTELVARLLLTIRLAWKIVTDTRPLIVACTVRWIPEATTSMNVETTAPVESNAFTTLFKCSVPVT